MTVAVGPLPVAVTTYEYVTALRSWLPMVNPNEAGLPATRCLGSVDGSLKYSSVNAAGSRVVEDRNCLTAAGNPHIPAPKSPIATRTASRIRTLNDPSKDIGRPKS